MWFMSKTLSKIRLTAEREANGLSKAALARAARHDQALISKIESGRVKPYPSELGRIADALGWPRQDAESLLRRTDGAE